MEINFVTLLAFSLVCSRSIINLSGMIAKFLFLSKCIEISVDFFYSNEIKNFFADIYSK